MIVLKAAQEKILGALQAVAGIVERRHTLPILANVLLRKTGDTIEFTTSDLEISPRSASSSAAAITRRCCTRCARWRPSAARTAS